MHHTSQLECRPGRSDMTQEQSVKSFPHQPACRHRIVRPREPNWLVAERRKQFFTGEQPLAYIIDNQHRFPVPKLETGCLITRWRCCSGSARKPNLKTAAGTWRAPDVNRTAVLAHNFAHRRKPQAAAGYTSGKEWFENVLQDGLVHAAPGVAYRNVHVASRPQVPMRQRSGLAYLADLGFDLEAPALIHRLCAVIAKVEKDLLQLRGLTRHDGRVRHLADNQFDPRGQ